MLQRALSNSISFSRFRIYYSMQTKVFPFWGLMENAENGIDSLFLFCLNAIFLSLSLYFSRFPRSLQIPLLLVALSWL